MFDQKVKPGTPDGEILEIGLFLIKQYEGQQYAVSIQYPKVEI